MTATQLLVVYGLVMATTCFIALFVRMSRVRAKLDRLERAAQKAYDAGFRAGHSQASNEQQPNPDERYEE